MELYEIVKTEIIERFSNGYSGKPTVVTATLDKNMAEEMLAIYKYNCGERESYDIRIVGAPKTFGNDNYEHCLHCNSFNKCVDTIHLHPETNIRCMRFGELKEYIKGE